MAGKYGNTKVFSGGLKFDSKLELFMYKMLESYGIKNEFQVEIELVPSHRINKKAIRRTCLIVDFVIKLDDKILYIDTKGFPTELSKLKYKLLGYKKLNEGADFEIIWLKNKGEVLEFINKISKNE